MLEFVAETAQGAGLTDYRVVVNVGAGAGQTVFHLHWHILGGRPMGETPVTLIEELEHEVRTRCAPATPRGATRCA